MKTTIAAMIVLMLVTAQTWAFEPITDKELGEISAQAGVSIMIDNVVIYQSIAKIEYTDTDIGGGAIGISAYDYTWTINAIGGSIDPAKYGLTEAECKPLTIDVAQLDSVAGITGTAIVIGIPTVELTGTETSFSIYIGDEATGSVGKFVYGDRLKAYLGGTIYIAAH